MKHERQVGEEPLPVTMSASFDASTLPSIAIAIDAAVFRTDGAGGTLAVVEQRAGGQSGLQISATQVRAYCKAPADNISGSHGGAVRMNAAHAAAATATEIDATRRASDTSASSAAAVVPPIARVTIVARSPRMGTSSHPPASDPAMAPSVFAAYTCAAVAASLVGRFANRPYPLKRSPAAPAETPHPARA